MKKGDDARCKQLLQQLKADQDPEFYCKSLCNLAKAAQDLGSYRFQFELADEAVAIWPRDQVAWCQKAHAQLKLGHPQEALKTYEEAIETFPSDVVARTGRAEVLRALNRLDEAPGCL